MEHTLDGRRRDLVAGHVQPGEGGETLQGPCAIGADGVLPDGELGEVGQAAQRAGSRVADIVIPQMQGCFSSTGVLEDPDVARA